MTTRDDGPMLPPLYVITRNTDDPQLQGYGTNHAVMPHDYSETVKPGQVECILAFRSESEAWRWLGVTDIESDHTHTRAMRSMWRVTRLHTNCSMDTARAMVQVAMDFDKICHQRDALLIAAEQLTIIAQRVRKEVPT